MEYILSVVHWIHPFEFGMQRQGNVFTLLQVPTKMAIENCTICNILGKPFNLNGEDDFGVSSAENKYLYQEKH